MLKLIKALFQKPVQIETTGVYKAYIYQTKDTEYTITEQEIRTRCQTELDNIKTQRIIFNKQLDKEEEEVKTNTIKELIKLKGGNV